MSRSTRKKDDPISQVASLKCTRYVLDRDSKADEVLKLLQYSLMKFALRMDSLLLYHPIQPGQNQAKFELLDSLDDSSVLPFPILGLREQRPIQFRQLDDDCTALSTLRSRCSRISSAKSARDYSDMFVALFQ